MKVAMLDLETSNLSADYGIILCAVFKPYMGKPVVLRLDKTKSYKNKKWDDTELVKQIQDYIKKSGLDIIVTYNGVYFDKPFLTSRILGNFLHTDGTEIKHIDLMWVAKKNLRLHDNKLDTVARFLKCKVAKTHIDGSTWTRALTGDRTSFDYIVDHCVKDVEVLEEVYDKLKVYVKKVW